MEVASRDRIVWTDDDFHHPGNWLIQLHADYERHGPITEIPFFVGRDPLAIFLEPIYAVGGTLGTYVGDIAWGGAVLFERTDLDEGSSFGTFAAPLATMASSPSTSRSRHSDERDAFQPAGRYARR